MSKIAPVRITDVSGSPLGTVTNPVIVQSAGEGNSDAGGTTLVGKGSGGDFTAVYLAATTITLGVFPDGTAATGDDITLVQQINSTGAVVATYDRNDTTMAIAGGVLTVTGATFAASDIFVIYTNVPRSSSSTKTDDAAFTPGTSTVTPAGFFADETASDSVDEGDTGAARMTLDRKQITASEQKEDSVFADTSYLSLGGQEIDDPTALATMTEGDVGNFKGDLSGRHIVTLGTLSAGEDLTNNIVAMAMKPLAVATYTYSRDSSVALEASSISKASAGNLYRAFGVIDATAATDIYYIQFLDSATLTADGAVTHLITPVPVNHTTGTDSSFDTGHFDAGVAATAGIVIVASTTMVLKTIAGSVLFATVLFK